MASQKKPKKGQISVLIIFSLIPLFVLFAFAVNIGMLVNAKIALQNAADLAAYAGAAAQARQMTGISHLNYMLRQNYKKFLFRYYVVGNYGTSCFPRAGGAVPPGCPAINDTDDFHWTNYGKTADGSVGSTSNFPGLPVVCIQYSIKANPCQLQKVLPLVTLPDCLFGPTCEALQGALAVIQDIQKVGCKAHKLLNLEVLAHWLYSTTTDPLNTQPALSNLIRGYGLVPENLMTMKRIETLQSYINEQAYEVTPASLNSLEGVADRGKTERTVLAYKTIMGNLNRNVFQDESSIVMKELMPTGMLELTKIQPKIDVPYIVFEDHGSADSASCELQISTLGARPYVGVYKTASQPENSDVFYAIKLKAKARILFNPFPFGSPDSGGIELTAYAAAKPFGSRIGPTVKEEDFTKPETLNLPNETGVVTATAVKIPFLRISDTQTYEKYGILKSLADPFIATEMGGGSTISPPTLMQGSLGALLPDAVELGKYNIPSDSETMPSPNLSAGMVQYYGGPQSSFNFDETEGNRFYQLWAPVVPPGSSITVLKDQFKAEIEQNLSFSTTGAVFGGDLAELKANLAKYMLDETDKMVGALQQSSHFNIAWIFDPMASAFFEGQSKSRPAIADKHTNPENVDKLATSYTTGNDSGMYASGRDGYSVKFIPLQYALSASHADGLKGEQNEIVKVQH